MKLSIITRPTQAIWGGDLKALYSLKEGLEKLHHEVVLIPTQKNALQNVILSSYQHLPGPHRKLSLSHEEEEKIWIICFHEDFERYLRYAYGMHTYIQNSLRFPSGPILNDCLQRLEDNPEIIRWHSRAYIDSRRNAQVMCIRGILRS